MGLLGHIKGIVAEIGENATVKVRLPEYDDLITDWLPVAQSLTLGAKCYTVPRVDTQVIVLPGQGIEDAIVIGAIYSKPDPAPFEDAAIIGLVADTIPGLPGRRHKQSAGGVDTAYKAKRRSG